MPDPVEYPPEKFETYRAAAEASGNYRVDEDIDRWARFWSAQGYKKPVLEALEAYDRNRSLFSGEPKLRFELTMEVRGKQAAYQAVVVAQRNRYGWNRYFSRHEDLEYLWTKLKEIYPEKWLDFMQSTLMADPEHLNRSGVTVRSYISQLVEFLIFLGQPDTAKAVARAATETTLQLVPLDIPAPTWTSTGVV
jgi:hypothetical protein